MLSEGQTKVLEFGGLVKVRCFSVLEKVFFAMRLNPKLCSRDLEKGPAIWSNPNSSPWLYVGSFWMKFLIGL